MARLPEPRSLPHFQWIDESGRIQPLPYESGSDVREITDYVLDSNDWPCTQATVHSVLTRTTFDRECEVCGHRRDSCEGLPCIDYFQTIIAVVGKRMCDIKGAAELGKGVFANRKIPSGSIIGEYLGRLYPLGTRGVPGDRYVFVINEIAEVSALQYGNLTRFFNHHCHHNIKPRLGMYGRRQVVLYEANRDIEAGEQLCVNYGSRYFFWPSHPCKCDAQIGDHLPGGFDLQATTRGEAGACDVRTSQNSSHTQSQNLKLDTLSKQAWRDVATGTSTRPSITTRNPTAITSKKRRQENPAAVLNNLTRNAGVCRRYGPQVYTSFLRRIEKY